MTNEEKIKIEKEMKLIRLRSYLGRFPTLINYYDIESDKLIDEKIGVLEAVKAGKTIDEIPGFYDIFELLPKEDIWD